MLRISFIFCFTLVFLSCDKDDESAREVEVEVENFFGLKVGNTYSYSYHRRINATDQFETTSWTDEVEITNEVIIDGATYFEYTSTTASDGSDSFPGLENGIKVTTLRDVDGVLQDETKAILFSNVVDSEPYIISEDDWGNVFGERLSETIEQSVPAGNFDCNVNNKYAILSTGEQAPALDVILYADGIGQVYSTISTVSNPLHIWEKRLVTYTIAD